MGFVVLASFDDTLSISHKKDIKKSFFHEKYLIELLFPFLWFAVYSPVYTDGKAVVIHCLSSAVVSMQQSEVVVRDLFHRYEGHFSNMDSQTSD